MANLETLGTLERRLTFSVKPSEFEPEIRNRLSQLARNARLPGFRPGKVPMKMIEQSYGAQVHAEVLGDSVTKTLNDEIGKLNLRVAGQPTIERHTEGIADSELGFAATFEVFPDIKLGAPQQLVLERFSCAVTDADVDKTIEVLRKQRATWHAVEQPAAAGDRVTLDFAGTLDGQPFDGGQAKDFALVLGEGRMLADFEAGVLGRKVGETPTISVNFPADYGAEHLAGKTASFALQIHKVESPQLPELDVALAKQLGVADGDVAKLRAEVRANLEREVAARTKARTKTSAMSAISTWAELETPKALVASEREALVENAQKELEQRGVDPKKLPIPDDAFMDQAKQRVRLGLIVGEIVKTNKLNPKPDQIKRQIEEFAQAYENPAEVTRWYFSDRERLAQIEAMVIEQNVVDWALANGQVTEQVVPFDELMRSSGS